MSVKTAGLDADDIRIGIGGYGNGRLDKLMLEGFQAWPVVVPGIQDSFPEADADPINSPWAAMATDGVTTNLGRRPGARLGNRFNSTTNPPVATNGTNCASYHTTALATDDMEAGAILATSPSGTITAGYSANIALRAAPNQADTYISSNVFTSSNAPGIYKRVSGTDTLLGTAPPARAVALGSYVKFRAVGNVLRQYVNGVQTYTVTDATHSRGSGYRYAGLRTLCLRSTAGGAVTYSPGWDDFWARDVSTTIPVESQAVYQSGGQAVATGATWVTVGNSAVIPTAAGGMTGKSPYVKETRFEGTALVVTGQGTVDINARVQMTASATALEVRILKNGTPIASSATITATAQTISATGVSVVDGDTISFQVRHTAGASRTISTGATATYLEMVSTSGGAVTPTTPSLEYGDDFGTYSGPQMAVRMNHTGTTPRFGANTWADLTGWVAQNDNHYSGSVVGSSLWLTAPSAWDNARISAHVPYIGGVGTGVSQVRIVRESDGAIIATSPTARSGTANKNYAIATGVNVAAGERFKIQGHSTLSTPPYPAIPASGTDGAYLSIEQQVVESLNPSLWESFSTAAGAGTINIVNGQANGEGTPSLPESYAAYRFDMPSDNYRVWLKYTGQVDAYHSSVSVVLAIDAARTKWVEFGLCKTKGALTVWDGSAYVVQAQDATTAATSHFVYGCVIELWKVGTTYTAYLDGVQMPSMSATIPTGTVPSTSRGVGIMFQDDSREDPSTSGLTDAGSPTPRVPFWKAAPL
jgi:hypothetical protein